VADPSKQRPGDQPLPEPGRECVQDALIAQIEERKQLGIERYGRPLETHNGRDAVQDAVEEAIDLAVYLKQVELEMRDVRAERDQLATTLDEVLRQFVHRTHPGQPCLQSNHVSADQVDDWRSVLATKGAPR
jgi:hypothetical protein